MKQVSVIEGSAFLCTGRGREGRWCSGSSGDGGGGGSVLTAAGTPAASRTLHCRSSEAGRLWPVKKSIRNLSNLLDSKY